MEGDTVLIDEAVRHVAATHFPQHQPQRVDVNLAERLEDGHVDPGGEEERDDGQN